MSVTGMHNSRKLGAAVVAISTLAHVCCGRRVEPQSDSPQHVQDACPSTILRLSGAAAFSFGNEPSSAVLFVCGCTRELASLTEQDKAAVYRALQQWVQASPESFPICNEKPRTVSWAGRVNQAVGRSVAVDACLELTSGAL
jgi:hypothetical protein